MIRCVDAKTGQVCWTHETKGEIWASPLVADGKVYVGTHRRDFWILAAGREKKVISTITLDSLADCDRTLVDSRQAGDVRRAIRIAHGWSQTIFSHRSRG